MTSESTFRKASQVHEGWDDEELLAALREAIQARQAVPSWFVEAATNAYALHNIDAERAQLTCDSGNDLSPAAGKRSETASIRALTFTSPQVSLKLEVTECSLLGQIIPPRAGTVETHITAGASSSPVDQVGYFAVKPMPASPFRLRFRTVDGTDVLTDWITL
jgi:hypothetical protein